MSDKEQNREAHGRTASAGCATGLRAYTNEMDTFIAADRAQLEGMLLEEGIDYNEAEWEELDDEMPITLVWEEHEDYADLIDRPSFGPDPAEVSGTVRVSGTAAQWAEWSGPGHLCSTEW